MIYKTGMRLTMILAISVGLFPVSARADTLYLNDVLSNQEYSIPYGRMLQGEKNLPRWMSTPIGVIGGTTSAGSDVEKIDGKDERIFYNCKSHDCDSTALIVAFDEDGYASGVLLTGRETRFFGHPSTAEMRAMLAHDTRGKQ